MSDEVMYKYVRGKGWVFDRDDVIYVSLDLGSTTATSSYVGVISGIITTSNVVAYYPRSIMYMDDI